MVSQVGSLLRAGLALKIGHLRQATQSYFRDQTAHQKGIAASYAIGGGMYAAAGVFLIAACLIGAAALFRWIEIQYGEFPAYGAAGGLLIVLTVVCAIVAASAFRPHPAKFPGLTSRLRVALRANPIKLKAPTGAVAKAREASIPVTGRANPLEVARHAAVDVLRAPSSPIRGRPMRQRLTAPVGLAVTASLLGWALLRRHQQTGKVDI